MREIILIFVLSLFSTLSFANSADTILKKEMPYLKARNALQKQGWYPFPVRTTLADEPICHDNRKDCKEMYEIESCSGTGQGFCKMYFTDKTYDHYLEIITIGGDPSDEYADDVIIESWQTIDELPKHFAYFEQDNAPATTNIINKHEEQCLSERDTQRLILKQLAQRPYLDVVNDWREMYYAKDISFSSYQYILNYASIFSKMPEHYATEEEREKLVNALFDICVRYPK